MADVSNRSYEAFRSALGQRESSNRYDCKNQWGYLGRWQFGKMRLCDLGLCVRTRQRGFAWVPGLTDEVFLGNPYLQDAVFDVHVAKLRIVVLGFFKKYLDTVLPGGLALTMSGAIAIMHLHGPGGLAAIIKGDDRADALGTKASEYGRLFAGYNIPSTLPTRVDVLMAMARASATANKPA